MQFLSNGVSYHLVTEHFLLIHQMSTSEILNTYRDITVPSEFAAVSNSDKCSVANYCKCLNLSIKSMILCFKHLFEHTHTSLRWFRSSQKSPLYALVRLLQPSPGTGADTVQPTVSALTPRPRSCTQRDRAWTETRGRQAKGQSCRFLCNAGHSGRGSAPSLCSNLCPPPLPVH